jgi:broad specificity phosphatase PhoE
MNRKWIYSIAVIAALVVVVPWWWLCGAQTTVMLIRHADRSGSLDALSPAGFVRAQELVHVMEKAGLQAIIRSEFTRTQQTAAPLAAVTGLTPIVIASSDIQAVVDEIRNNQRGRRVLVVGHSNTVPSIIAGLGGPTLPNIDDNEFDNLFVMTLCRCRWFVAPPINLQYGAASP